MTNSTAAWIALTETADLPIARTPVLRAAQGVADVRSVPLPYRVLTEDEERQYAARLDGAGGILLRSGYFTEGLLKRLPSLQVVAVHGTGVDPVDVVACTARGVWVTNTPGANADAVAELTIGLMVSLIRRIPQCIASARNGRAWDTARRTGGELRGRTLGLLGIGEIGARVARVAVAFGMEVCAYDPAVDEVEIGRRGAVAVSLERLLRTADVVSLHAPAMPATHHIIDSTALAQMKPDALLINCARGSLVDEIALAEALTRERLGGAALDVLDGEPPDPSSPIFAAPNVLVTPHMAGSTHECLRSIARVASEDIVRVLKSQAPLHPVNAPNGNSQ